MTQISDYRVATRNYPEAWVDEEIFSKTLMPYPEPIVLFPKLKTVTYSKFKELKQNPFLEVNTDLMDDAPKFVCKYDHFIGHTILDTWAWLLYVIRVKPNFKVVLAIESGTYSYITKPFEGNPGYEKRYTLEKMMFEYTTSLLDNLKIDYVIATIDSKHVYAIDNAYFLYRMPPDYLRSAAVSSMIDTLMQTIPKDIKEKTPDKIVYLSRGKTYHGYSGTFPMLDGEKDISVNELRIINEPLLEDFLKSHGVEIVYPEDFDNFQDQLNFIHQVKTMIAPTTSGLNNQFWMQNGGKVLELCTPLYMQDNATTGKPIFEIHSHYQGNAILKEHQFTRVPIIDKNAEAIIEIFNNNPYLLSFIKD